MDTFVIFNSVKPISSAMLVLTAFFLFRFSIPVTEFEKFHDSFSHSKEEKYTSKLNAYRMSDIFFLFIFLSIYTEVFTAVFSKSLFRNSFVGFMKKFIFLFH